ncbi:MAG: adenylate/guanylate cyclase domain-containing protein [Chthoniobacter sp.]|uniref:adenylate/guanylate cyclase domain-containing protein n=1 Tax=Chthoniobacter sp. TaxID=2510640 RepID=UPI0032A3BF52
MKRGTWFWLVAGFLILGLCGYLLPRAWLNLADHNAYQQLLRDARQLDHEINEAVLSARLGLLLHYDPLVEKTAALKRTHAALANTPSYMLVPGRQTLTDHLKQAEGLRARKAVLIEQFKTDFAVLRNSLAYFPKLVTDISHRFSTRDDGGEVIPLLNRILEDALVYHHTASPENESRLRSGLEALQGHLAAVGDRTDAADLQLVLAHANVILQRKPIVEALLGELVNMPTSPIYDAMQMRLDSEYAGAQSRAQGQRLVVYVLSMLMLIGVFSLIIRQFTHSDRALRVAEKKFRSIFEKAGEGIFQTTPDGQYLEANPALARFYGYGSVSELIQQITDIRGQLYVDPKRRDAFRRQLEKDGHVFSFESEIRRKDGSIAWISENAHAVRDSASKLLYYEGIVADITQRKNADYDRERRNQRELLHQRCLLGLAQFDKTDFKKALCEILDTTAYTLGVNRVTAWRLFDAGTPEESIKAIGTFDLDRREHRSDEYHFHSRDFPNYFAAIRRETCIAAPDAVTDPRMSEFAECYLQPLGVASTLDVPIWAQGHLAGVFTIERTGARHEWEDDEVDFALSAANLVAVCFETAERVLAQKEAARERERAEQLLLNILPGTIARRLQAGEGLIADSFAEATVLFADIVNFTELSAGIPPQAVVSLLNKIFSAFDQLAEDFGLEKIKTIGDAYMVVGGVPAPRGDHVEAVAEMALRMLDRCAELTRDARVPVNMRIGINTGPVVAGVIGIKKFIYDLWGDTVNLASRMESHGVSGHIQVTTAVYERLRGKYTFVDRGLIDIKGRGQQTVFLLKGPCTETATTTV